MILVAIWSGTLKSQSKNWLNRARARVFAGTGTHRLQCYHRSIDMRNSIQMSHYPPRIYFIVAIHCSAHNTLDMNGTNGGWLHANQMHRITDILLHSHTHAHLSLLHHFRCDAIENEWAQVSVRELQTKNYLHCVWWRTARLPIRRLIESFIDSYMNAVCMLVDQLHLRH